MNNRRKIFALVIVLLALASVSLAACVRPGTPVASGPASGGGVVSSSSNEVHMGAIDFVQKSITITKGSKLTLIDDTSVLHIIDNGAWDNGTAQPAKESGAPTVQQTFNGNDKNDIGPFTTAGTFKFYCTVHTNMNLTVIVK